MTEPWHNVRKVAGNDCLEVWTMESGEQRTFMHHDRQTLDQRAKLAVSFLQAWGAANLIGDALKNSLNDQPHLRKASSQTIEQLVFVAADTADAIYAEAHKRGWLLDLPTFKENEP